MTAISYREYATDLQGRIDRLRTSELVSASIEIAICRNAFCYKSEEVTGLNGSRRCSAGPLNSPAGLVEEDSTSTAREIAAFFALPEIYAYSDLALADGRSPLLRSHWDGTVALIEVRYETAVTTWHQRMLFIGFDDPIHADFAVGLDSDLFINGDHRGRQLFEWRTDSVQSPVIEIASNRPQMGAEIPLSLSPSLRGRFIQLVNEKWRGLTGRRDQALSSVSNVISGYGRNPNSSI